MTVILEILADNQQNSLYRIDEMLHFKDIKSDIILSVPSALQLS